MIDQRLGRTFAPGTYDYWVPSQSSSLCELDAGPAIPIAKRYFTPIKDVLPSEPRVPFSTDIDPHKVLASAMGSAYAHTEDNVVQYLRRCDKG